MPVKASCHKCAESWEFDPPMGRAAECPKCHWDAHVCLNCKHYDRNAHHECREEQAEFVQIKDRSNFCDYFDCRSSAQVSSQPANHREHLEKLFGAKQDSPAKSDPTKSIADELSAFLQSKK